MGNGAKIDTGMLSSGNVWNSSGGSLERMYSSRAGSEGADKVIEEASR